MLILNLLSISDFANKLDIEKKKWPLKVVFSLFIKHFFEKFYLLVIIINVYI